MFQVFDTALLSLCRFPSDCAGVPNSVTFEFTFRLYCTCGLLAQFVISRLISKVKHSDEQAYGLHSPTASAKLWICIEWDLCSLLTANEFNTSLIPDRLFTPWPKHASGASGRLSWLEWLPWDLAACIHTVFHPLKANTVKSFLQIDASLIASGNNCILLNSVAHQNSSTVGCHTRCYRFLSDLFSISAGQSWTPFVNRSLLRNFNKEIQFFCKLWHPGKMHFQFCRQMILFIVAGVSWEALTGYTYSVNASGDLKKKSFREFPTVFVRSY